MNVVRVKVVVYEDDVEVAQTGVGYYEGQLYVVKIDTPDGVDAQITRTAESAKAKA